MYNQQERNPSDIERPLLDSRWFIANAQALRICVTLFRPGGSSPFTTTVNCRAILNGTRCRRLQANGS
jgi:hypothetical protein